MKHPGQFEINCNETDPVLKKDLTSSPGLIAPIEAPEAVSVKTPMASLLVEFKDIVSTMMSRVVKFQCEIKDEEEAQRLINLLESDLMRARELTDSLLALESSPQTDRDRLNHAV